MMDESVSILREMAGHSAGRSILQLHSKTISEAAAVPIDVIWRKRTGEFITGRRASAHTPECCAIQVSAQIRRHVSTCFVVEYDILIRTADRWQLLRLLA
jgi:hypothetical protein